MTKTLEGPLLVCEWRDRETAARGYFVVDTLDDGLCAGGIRMRAGLSVEEVKRLARTMTLKLAGVGTPFGGAKGGIDYDPSATDAAGVLRRFLEAVKPFLAHSWLTNQDLGTSAEWVFSILDILGLSSPFQAVASRAKDSNRVLESADRLGALCVDGTPLMDQATGYGVAEVTMEALQLLNRPIAGTRVAVQGFGSAGASAAKFLSRAGMLIVAIANSKGAIYCPAGLDIDSLLQKRSQGSIIDRSILREIG